MTTVQRQHNRSSEGLLTPAHFSDLTTEQSIAKPQVSAFRGPEQRVSNRLPRVVTLLTLLSWLLTPSELRLITPTQFAAHFSPNLLTGRRPLRSRAPVAMVPDISHSPLRCWQRRGEGLAARRPQTTERSGGAVGHDLMTADPASIDLGTAGVPEPTAHRRRAAGAADSNRSAPAGAGCVCTVVG